MINALQTAANFIDRKIGWSRIGLIVSLTIIAVALHTLFKLLQHIDIQKIIDAIREKQGREIAIAAGAVAAGYFTLTFYDLFALRTIGPDDILYRIAALSGFTSYAVGHNIGATVLTGGAVRYRIYSAHGLDAVEVAKLCFVAGLTFWLGNATVLGLGILYVPGAAARVDQLPPSVNAVVAVIALIILAAYIVWVWSGRRTLGRGGWLVELPRSLDAVADHHWHRRSLVLHAGNVHAAAGPAAYRLCDAGRYFRVGNAFGICQPCAGWHRRVRRGDDDCAVAVR